MALRKIPIALYFANGLGAIGHLLLVYFILRASGAIAYAHISLYLISFAVLLAFEPAVLRRAIVAFEGSNGKQRAESLASAWSLCALSLGIPLAALVSLLTLAAGLSYWQSLLLLSIGVIDYAVGKPLLLRNMHYSYQKEQLYLASVAAVQNVSRFGFLMLLFWLGDGGAEWLLLLPFRRVLECVALRPVPLSSATRRYELGPGVRDLRAAILAYGAPTAWMLAATEGLGMLVLRAFGPAEFGLYRGIFDVASKLWFVSSIFPTIVFPRLRSIGLSAASATTLARILAGSWVIYLVVSVFGAAIANALSGGAGYFFVVLVGVAMTGHARLGLECLQAFDAERVATRATAKFAVVTIATFLVLAPTGSPVVAIGTAWVAGGLFLSTYVDNRVLARLGFSGSKRAAYVVWMIFLLGVALLTSWSTALWN